MIEVDSRFRGNDGLEKTIGECGLPSLAVNSSHTLFLPGTIVFCAVIACMGKIFCNWQIEPDHQNKLPTVSRSQAIEVFERDKTMIR